MDRSIIKTIAVVFFLLHIALGGFLLYVLFAPEVAVDIEKIQIQVEEKYQVEVPKEDKLIIPKIGVDMGIGIESSFLDSGGWVQDLHPQNDKPMVIAIHRFGWSTLTPDEKIQKTLYHVDKLKEGDEITMFWNNEKFSYRIITIETDTNNPSIGKNQILIYTCRWWNSAERVFVLAEEI